MEKLTIKLYDILLCLSNALELLSPKLYNHHQQTAYMSYIIAEHLGLPANKKRDLFYAALIHDIGTLFGSENLEIAETETVSIKYHGFRGWRLLKNFEPLKHSAQIIKYHHVSYEYGKGMQFENENVPEESHIIHLADRVCMAFAQKKNILSQVGSVLDYIESRAGSVFDPVYVEVLKKAAQKEYIWLNLFSRSPIEHIQEQICDATVLSSDETLEFTQIISHVIDFKSRFTACHSAGVAQIAKEIARLMHFSESECIMMQIAGHLHDIGKLAVSNRILEKDNVLEIHEYAEMKAHTYYTYHLLNIVPEFSIIKEWAAYHHEKLNGNGYPFHLSGENLTLGSRIMTVSDIFAAITEDRPYRKGMEKEKAVNVLEQMVERNEIDKNVVKVLFENYDNILQVRKKAQKAALIEFDKFTAPFV